MKQTFYRYRSYTPIPFIIVVLVFQQPHKVLFVVGLLLSAIGEAVRLWALAYIGPKTRSSRKIRADHLVVNGPFSYIRNPLYLGNLLISTGVVLGAGNLWLLFLVPCVYAFWHCYIIPAEEEFLEATFGGAYQAYCGQVRRYLPRWTPYSRGPATFQFGETILGELNTIVAAELLFVVFGRTWLSWPGIP